MANLDQLVSLSPFAHFIPADSGYVGVLNSLNLGVVGVPSELQGSLERLKSTPTGRSSLLREFGSSLVEALEHQRLLGPTDGGFRDLEVARKHLEHAPVGILYLLLTDICNIRCKYCYFEGALPADHKFAFMSPDVALKGVDLFIDTLQEGVARGLTEPQIILYGGEPVANWKVMKKVLLYVQEKLAEGLLPAQTSVTINSNGTLITPAIADDLAQYSFVTMAISIDGPAELHDELRVDRRGRGTFAAADRGIRYLQDAGVRLGLCCTLGSHNLPYAEAILLWLREAYNVSSVGFNLLLPSPGAMPIPEGYEQESTEKLLRCFAVAREFGIYEDRIMRKVRSFVDGQIYFYDCAGCGQQLVVSPDGMVGTCQAYSGSRKHFVPLSMTLDPHDHPLWEEWRHRSPIGMEQCEHCVALGNCGGGCAFSADLQKGSIWELDDRFCHFSREVIHYLVRDLIQQMTC